MHDLPQNIQLIIKRSADRREKVLDHPWKTRVFWNRTRDLPHPKAKKKMSHTGGSTRAPTEMELELQLTAVGLQLTAVGCNRRRLASSRRRLASSRRRLASNRRRLASNRRRLAVTDGGGAHPLSNNKKKPCPLGDVLVMIETTLLSRDGSPMRHPSSSDLPQSILHQGSQGFCTQTTHQQNTQSARRIISSPILWHPRPGLQRPQLASAP